MRKYFILASAALALASCSSDDFIGNTPGSEPNSSSSAIMFDGGMGKITRTVNGGNAAKLLGNKFYVLGTKGTLPDGSPTNTKVFDNYQVVWSAGTAGTTDDNSNDWAYVGKEITEFNANYKKDADPKVLQTIKFWDYSADQYDFIAFAVGGNTIAKAEANQQDEATGGTTEATKIIATPIATPVKGTDDTSPKYVSYSLTGTKIDDLKKCYYTDVTTVEKDNYGKPVQLTFKNMTAKIRVAFYETIPGYTVSDIKFYKEDPKTQQDGADTQQGQPTNKATLYLTGEDQLQTSGTLTVTYPIVGKTERDKTDNKSPFYNKALVSITAATGEGVDKTQSIDLGSVNYPTGDNVASVIATTAKEATMAGTEADSYYSPVLPVATAKPLTLRIDYKLTSTDGSNETINVKGAKAVIPASYTAWQPNYAYTYIFKISENTNGSTGTDKDNKDVEGLFPITFDAVVADVADANNHESITSVATPSITTYAWDTTNKKVVKAWGNGSEYLASTNTEIYVSVYDNGNVCKDLNEKGKLYTVTKNNAKYDASEAEIIDALQVQTSSTETTDLDASTTITGRNGITLTSATLTIANEIPRENGQNIKIDTNNNNSVAKFTASEEAKTYAFVYKKQDGTTMTHYTAYIAKGTETAGENEYYEDPNGIKAITQGTTLTASTIYYVKYTNNNNVYGVKVIKTYKPTTTE